MNMKKTASSPRKDVDPVIEGVYDKKLFNVDMAVFHAWVERVLEATK